MTVQLSRRAFLASLAAVAALGRATLAVEPDLEPGLQGVPIDRITADPNDRLMSPPSPEYDKELIRSIRSYGILTPLVITTKGRLLSGFRRLDAAKTLGLTHVPAHVIEFEGKSPWLQDAAFSNYWQQRRPSGEPLSGSTVRRLPKS